MADALVGCTGFVGTTLLKQKAFEAQYHSTDIGEIVGKSFDLVVCAAAPAQKWIANREPEADRLRIDGLIDRLRTIRCNAFVLVSTVDVFKSPIGVDEDTPIEELGLHPYGLHRRRLERFVEEQFAEHLIFRLPGLVGPGLRKNVMFDFLNDNNIHAIDSRGVFQFYPVVNLWADIQAALRAKLKVVHCTAEPISVSQVAAEGFGRQFDQVLAGSPAVYDMQSINAAAFGGSGVYQYSRRETIQAIRAYAQSERRATEAGRGVSS